MMGRWSIFGGFVLLALLLAACFVAVFKIDLAPVAEKKRGPIRTRNFGEGIHLSQKGLIGIDLVSIGRAHMRKLRKGPFTIGAINELVLEDVSLALPEELWAEDATSSPRQDKTTSSSDRRDEGTASTGRGTAAKRMLAALGISPGHIRMGEKIPRFSALTIRNLMVSRIVDGTNAVPWFTASSAKADRDGLALYSGYSVENGVTNSWKEALLAVEPKLTLCHP